jgi:hypothetical protein
MKNRLFAFLLAITIIFSLFPASVAADNDNAIKVFYIGEEIPFPVPPQIISNSTMVPMRTIFETFGYNISWDADTKTVTAENADYLITITIGSPNATVNTTDYTLDTPAVLVNGSTLVPLRFIGEASGYLVSWNGADKSVHIEYSEEQKAALEDLKASYIDELTYVKKNLPALHKNLFALLKQADFNSEMDALIKDVPNLTEDEIKFKLMTIINSVGDSHTSASLDTYSRFPLDFYVFDDGIYLRDTIAANKDFICKKLTAINGYSIEQVKEKLLPIIPQENDALIKYDFGNYLSCGRLLKMAGIIKSYSAVPYQFGNETVYTSLAYFDQWYSTALQERTLPLYRQNPNQNFWYSMIPEQDAIYVKYNKCAEIDYPFSSFTEDVFADLDKEKADTLIIDLRDNGGGSSPLFDPFLAAIKKRSNINKNGHLFVIVGRRTFSSAILNAMSLKSETNAIFIGEETGGSPNHYGQVQSFTLPNLRMVISYSTKYFKRANEDVHTFTPDIKVPLTSASFFAGKDDFLDAIWKQ